MKIVTEVQEGNYPTHPSQRDYIEQGIKSGPDFNNDQGDRMNTLSKVVKKAPKLELEVNVYLR
jgi:hypothetical protein